MAENVVIVGGNSGIGAAVRERLESRYSVCGFSRSARPAVDVTEKEPAFPEVEGPLTGLVFCPGSITLKPLRSLDVDDFRSDFDVNVLGAVRTLKHYLPKLLAADAASVVFFSTVAVQTGLPFHASISAAKGALEGLTRSLAAEFAPKTRFNAIALSLTETPLAQGLLRSEKQREAMNNRHPMKRIGRPEDAAAFVDLLLSDGGSWMTGEVLHLDGGMSALRV